MSDHKIVCLDPGHGPGTVNGSPDGRYKEREFAWDMAMRIKPLLEERGVKVVVTRTESSKPSLTDRAYISNATDADLFVSIHTNAPGAGADPDGDGWSSPRGLLIYTSQPGNEAPRNVAAVAVLSRMREAGIKIWNAGLLHNGYTVLTQTRAPAILIEYGFHTNREDVDLLLSSTYREKLAKATTDGICDFLGVVSDLEDREEGLDNTPDPWASEAVRIALEIGIIHGNGAGDLGLHRPVTLQQLLVILMRCAQWIRRQMGGGGNE